jgi:hypothetical protein
MSERALQALHALARFELIERAAVLARAVETRDEARGNVDILDHRCGAAARQIEETLQRGIENAPLLGALRRLLGEERNALRHWRNSLEAAEQSERDARLKLSRVRNREQVLQRVMKAQRRKREMQQEARGLVQADDRWLWQSLAGGVP